MANPEHLKILIRGVQEWNIWRKEHPGIIPDLRGAYLIREYLVGIDFSGTRLEGTNLEEAQLRNSDIRDARFDGETRFYCADLRGAKYDNWEICKTDVSEAIFDESTDIDEEHPDYEYYSYENEEGM